MNIRPASTIIIFTNVLSFMTMQTMFFLFIISQSIREIIKDKSIYIKSIIKGIPELDKSVSEYLNTIEFQSDYRIGLGNYIKREENNIQLLWSWMLSPFFIITVLLILSIIFNFFVKDSDKFDKIDFIILISVFGAFITEVIFYFIVISRTHIISDMDIFILIIKSINFDNLLPSLPPFLPPSFGPSFIPSFL